MAGLWEDDPDFQIIPDEKIIIKVKKAESDNDEDVLGDNEDNNTSSHNEVFLCLDNVIQWLDAAFVILKRLHGLATKKKE